MPTSIWADRLSRHLRLSILFHDNGCQKFKKSFLNGTLSDVATQTSPQSNIFKKIENPVFRLPRLAKRCAGDECGNN